MDLEWLDLRLFIERPRPIGYAQLTFIIVVEIWRVPEVHVKLCPPYLIELGRYLVNLHFIKAIINLSGNIYGINLWFCRVNLEKL